MGLWGAECTSVEVVSTMSTDLVASRVFCTLPRTRPSSFHSQNSPVSRVGSKIVTPVSQYRSREASMKIPSDSHSSSPRSGCCSCYAN